MPLLYILILAIVQGVTEFLPISSSGHLEIAWRFLNQSSGELTQGSEGDRLIIFVAVHLGTLLAVMIYFFRDVGMLGLGVVKLATGRVGPGARLALYILVASLPLIAAGYFLKDDLIRTLYDLKVIAWANIGFAVLLYMGDRWGMTLRRVEHMRMGSALVIGCAQVLALVPGTSRSGITMTAARFFGFERAEAARFSLLLAIPAILGAATLIGLDLYRTGDIRLGIDAAIAAGLAFVTALLAIALMMAWLRRATFTPFVIYRLLLGGILLWLAYRGEIEALIPVP